LEAQVTTSFQGKLAHSPQMIVNVFKARNALKERLMNLYVYAGLRNAEDVGNAQSSSAEARIQAKFAALMAPFSFVEPELLNVQNLESWIATEPLNTFAFDISELLREKKHVLSEAEEKLLANLSPIMGQFSSIHTKWNNIDLHFADAVDSQKQTHTLSHGRYGLLTASPDRALRQSAFETLHLEVSKNRNTIAANFYAKLLSGTLLAKTRHYQGFRHSQLAPDNIPLEVYDNLITDVRANLDALHKSMELRKNVLGIEKVEAFDRRVSLSNESTPEFYTYSQACSLILEAIKPLGEDYAEIATRGLSTERWVDYAENKGKRSGAFSWGTFSSNPVIHMTWTGTLDNVFTLAHELGHSMHSYFSNKTQPYHLASYTIFVAEVASTLVEGLLAQHLLKKFQGLPSMQNVISHQIEAFEGTVLRQVLFATFERDAAQKVDNGQPLGPDELDSIFHDLNKEWYGSEPHKMVKCEWMRIPHFYSTFYVYKYATSYCASQSLLQNLNTNSTETQKKILGLLKAGGSKAPLEILKDAGVDFMTPDPVRNAFSLYRDSIRTGERTFLKTVE
jgi:oligoendopeptidase F